MDGIVDGFFQLRGMTLYCRYCWRQPWLSPGAHVAFSILLTWLLHHFPILAVAVHGADHSIIHFLYNFHYIGNLISYKKFVLHVYEMSGCYISYAECQVILDFLVLLSLLVQSKTFRTSPGLPGIPIVIRLYNTI